MIRELKIQSSLLERVAYSTSERSLLVLFAKGDAPVWEYQDVDPDLVAELETASSQGSAFAKKVRGNHPEVRVGTGTADFVRRYRELKPEVALAGFYARLDEARRKPGKRVVICF